MFCEHWSVHSCAAAASIPPLVQSSSLEILRPISSQPSFAQVRSDAALQHALVILPGLNLARVVSREDRPQVKCSPIRLALSPPGIGYAGFFPTLAFAHLALCAAAIFLRAAAESLRFAFVGTTFPSVPAFADLTLAQRALWAAAILPRADAESFRGPVPFAYVLPKAASAALMP